MPSDDISSGKRFDAQQFIVGLYEGFRDFRDWQGIDERLPDGGDADRDETPAVGWGARIGYVVGAILRVAVYVSLTAVALMAMRGGV